MKNCLLCWLLALLCLTKANAQTTLSVGTPINGSVYQQDASHQGVIVVRGNFNSQTFATSGRYVLKATLRELDLVTGNRLGTTAINIQLLFENVPKPLPPSRCSRPAPN
jgi:hypothetical protein